MGVRAVASTPSNRTDHDAFLINGGLTTLARRFASPQVVLPWVYTSIGGPLFLIGFLIPSVRMGSIAAQMGIVPMLRAISIRKWLNVAASLFLAALLALITYAVLGLSKAGATLIFFTSVFGLGACNGIVELTSQEVMAKTIAPSRIAGLVARQTSIGGLVTLALALGIYVWDPYPDSRLSHLALIGMAALTWVMAAFSFAAIGEKPSPIQRKRSVWSEVRAGVALYRRERWFRRYTATRALFLSVGLAMPFYSIHAASLHQVSAHNLSAFVISTGLANLASGLVWGRLLSASPVTVLVLAGLLAATAGGIALAQEVLPRAEPLLLYAPVFALIELAVQGMLLASKTYVALIAPARNRPLYLAVNNMLLGFLAIGVSGILGFVAHMTHITWALCLLIALALVASTSALFLIPPPQRHRAQPV
jgi:hypothetical protein